MRLLINVTYFNTSVVGKMLEAIIAKAIRKHLDENKLIRHDGKVLANIS